MQTYEARLRSQRHSSIGWIPLHRDSEFRVSGRLEFSRLPVVTSSQNRTPDHGPRNPMPQAKLSRFGVCLDLPEMPETFIFKFYPPNLDHVKLKICRVSSRLYREYLFLKTEGPEHHKMRCQIPNTTIELACGTQSATFGHLFIDTRKLFWTQACCESESIRYLDTYRFLVSTQDHQDKPPEALHPWPRPETLIGFRV